MKTNKHLILNDLSNLLRTRLSDNLKDVMLFGSQALGKARPDSDYDFLIILKHKADWKTEREISDMCYEIDLKYNIITDTHVIGESELLTLRGKQPIFVNAISNGIHACVDRINDLREKLKEFVSERDWEQFHSPKNLAMGLNIESAELMEIFLWMPDEESYHLNGEKLNNFKEELGDIYIYLIHLAEKYGIDLIDCAEQKLVQNAAKYPAEKVKGSSKKYNEYSQE